VVLELMIKVSHLTEGRQWMKNDDNNLHDPLGQTSKNSIFSEINEEVYIIRLWGGMS
jgi:hypothetical protein